MNYNKNSWNEVKRFFELVFFKVKCALKAESSKSYLSYFWLILEPLLHLGAYYIVFKILLQRGGDNYALFLISGIVPWLWFSKSVASSNCSILSAKNLILQIRIYKLFFPLIPILKETFRFLIVLLILLLIFIAAGHTPTITWLNLLPILLTEYILIIGVSTILAGIIPLLPDLRLLVPSFIQLLMFGSGVFYNYEDFSQTKQEYFLLNPIAFILKSFRDILLNNASIEWGLFVLHLIFAIITLCVGVMIIHRLNNTYVKVMD